MRHFLRKEAPARWQKRGGMHANQAFGKFVVDAYLSRDHLEDVRGFLPADRVIVRRCAQQHTRQGGLSGGRPIHG